MFKKRLFILSYLFSGMMIFGSVGCKTRKFSEVNAWESDETREAAKIEIKSVVMQDWGKQLDFEARSQKVRQIAPAELDAVATEFAEEIVKKEQPKLENGDPDTKMEYEDGSRQLETYYDAFKSDRSELSTEDRILTQAHFRAKVMILFALRTNMDALIADKTQSLALRKKQ
jgi:hypothetical protein